MTKSRNKEIPQKVTSKKQKVNTFVIQIERT